MCSLSRRPNRRSASCPRLNHGLHAIAATPDSLVDLRTGLKATAETWLLTVDGAKGTWEQLDVAGPAARVAATLDALPDGRVLLSGGWDPATGGTLDDVWALAL